MQYQSSWLITFNIKYFFPIMWVGLGLFFGFILPELIIDLLIFYSLTMPLIIILSLVTKYIIATEEGLHVSNLFKRFYVPYRDIEKAYQIIPTTTMIGNCIYLKFKDNASFPWRRLLTIPRITVSEYFHRESNLFRFIKHQMEKTKRQPANATPTKEFG